MADLDVSIRKTLLHEGIYSNDPDDPGGETWRGIARRYQPDWPGWALIDDAKRRGVHPLTLQYDERLRALVTEFYRAQFAAPLYEAIESQELLDELFDFGVNVNPPNAVRALQEALKAKAAGPIVIDGKFGPKTLEILNALDAGPLLKEFRARQSVYYAAAMLRRFTRILRDSGLAISDELLKKADAYALKFALGWLRRVME